MSADTLEKSAPALFEVVHIDSTAVVITTPLDISSFDQLWLLHHGLLLKGEALENSTFSPAFVSVQTSGFQLLILPDRLQITVISRNHESAPTLIDRVIRGYFSALPAGTFRAMGFNFGAFLPNQGREDYARWNAENFCPPKLANSAFLTENKPTFGCLFILSAWGFKVQVHATAGQFSPAGSGLEIPDLPVRAGTTTMFTVVSFHRDLTNEDNVLEGLDRWPDALKMAGQIFELLS